MKKLKFLLPFLAMLFVTGSAFAEDITPMKKDLAQSEMIAEATHTVKFESKEALKLDDAEYTGIVATKSSIASGWSFGFASVAMLGLVALCVYIFRKLKPTFTLGNGVTYAVIAALAILVLQYTSATPDHGLSLAQFFGVGVPVATQIKSLREQKSDSLKAMESLIQKSETEKRNFTSEEKKKYETLKDEVEGFHDRLTRLNDQLALEKGEASARSNFKISDDEEDGESKSPERAFTIFKRAKSDVNKPITDWYLRNHDVNDTLKKANVFRMLSALATGKTKDNATERALAESRSVTGSALLNPYLSSQMWDAGLSKSHLAQAGMKIVPLESNEHKLAKILTYPTFEWKAESSATTDKSAVFTSATFNAKTLRGFVRASGELLQDGLNTESALRNVFSKSAGNSIDTAGLFGSGSGANPKGIFNYSGANVHEMGANGAALTNYDPYLEAIKLIYDDNGNTPGVSILSPRTWLTQSKFKDNTNQPLALPPAIKDMKFFETSKVPVDQTQGTETDASCIIMGGFESLYLGVRLDIQIMVSPVQSETFEYDFLTVFRGDFQAERETDFAIIKGIIPA